MKKLGGYVIITVPNKLRHTPYKISAKMQKAGDCPFGYGHWYTPGELKKIMIGNGLEPVYFASSAGDHSGNFRMLGKIWNLITGRFGK